MTIKKVVCCVDFIDNCYCFISLSFMHERKSEYLMHFPEKYITI